METKVILLETLTHIFFTDGTKVSKITTNNKPKEVFATLLLKSTKPVEIKQIVCVGSTHQDLHRYMNANNILIAEF